MASSKDFQAVYILMEAVPRIATIAHDGTYQTLKHLGLSISPFSNH